LATANPLDLDAERAVAFATGHRVRWQIASREEIARHLDAAYAQPASQPDSATPPVEVQHLGFSNDAVVVGDMAADGGASIIRLVDHLLAEAISAGASDLHLEPEEQGVAVRHRVDGVIRPVRSLPRSLGPSLVSRVKILSALDIADRMRPQDGRARVAVLGSVVDLRVSTLPVSHGEKVVVRVLDGNAGLRTLETIGFAAADLARIRSLLEQREGLILVTGPTGSGKTTTLYAALREIQQRGVNVVTVEDPIEYRLPGIVQVQVHERAGLTFGAALRSIVRQDPDVILVGEIRDRETAEIAIQASLTGHLVLSTLHTNDAASAVTRLVDVGVAPAKIATAVKGIIAQRLVRRACQPCEAAGCQVCRGLGYRGRRAVAEILITSTDVERRISAGDSAEAIAQAARAAGCVSLWESGLALVKSGATTMEELRRIAAEPVRTVKEAVRASGTDDVPITVLWTVTPDAEAQRRLREAQLVASFLKGRVQIVPLNASRPIGAVEPHAIVCTIGEAESLRAALPETPPAPLVVALAELAPGHHHLSMVGRAADLVLPRESSARFVLATVLSLLRWRSS
ncbi:MAG TPA: GspE/PulE family protein, partial [Gemmatimonadaceae bacterium]